MFARLSAVAITIAVAAPVWATPSDDLLAALGVERVVEIMRVEGLEYGADLARDMLPGGATAAWTSTVSSIYDTEAMTDVVRTEFTRVMGDQDLEPLLAYFQTDLGQRIVTLETEARQAMVDGDVEEAARATYRELEGTDDSRLAQLDALVEANDLVEANVAGAMNASYNFYAGLTEGGALEMSQTEILADVWGQEEETRQDTLEWLYGYLLLAYAPLSDAELDDYIELSASQSGVLLNRALFAGFNTMYDDISRELGLAAANQMQAQEL